MRGSELAKAMAAAVDRIVSAREGTGALDRAIKAIVGTIGWFGGKNAMSYLESYRAEMVMRDIAEGWGDSLGWRHRAFTRTSSGCRLDAGPVKSSRGGYLKDTSSMTRFGYRSEISWIGWRPQ